MMRKGHSDSELEVLAMASADTGLPFITKVLTPHDVGVVERYARFLQVGTRSRSPSGASSN